jgi:hypothetical protein
MVSLPLAVNVAVVAAMSLMTRITLPGDADASGIVIPSAALVSTFVHPATNAPSAVWTLMRGMSAWSTRTHRPVLDVDAMNS